MTQDPRRAAIVVAGGSGERFGRPGGKQLAPVAGKPVVAWTLAAVDDADVDLIVLVCPAEMRAVFKREAIEPFALRAPLVWAPAGGSRQESVRNGLDALPDSVDTVIVHDGARPLVTAETIARAVSALEQSAAQGTVVGHPSYDTLKCVEDGRVVATPDRSRYWAVQTPQVFRRDALVAAHAAAETDGFAGTDDAALIERLGGVVLLVEGPRDNVKVTVPEDVGYVEAALRGRSGGST